MVYYNGTCCININMQMLFLMYADDMIILMKNQKGYKNN